MKKICYRLLLKLEILFQAAAGLFLLMANVCGRKATFMYPKLCLENYSCLNKTLAAYYQTTGKRIVAAAIDRNKPAFGINCVGYVGQIDTKTKEQFASFESDPIKTYPIMFDNPSDASIKMVGELKKSGEELNIVANPKDIHITTSED